jgi:glycosyltransferase involved in cell wall biosynthesis
MTRDRSVFQPAAPRQAAERLRVGLEVTAESRPGSDRGIGRYLRTVRAANVALDHDVLEIKFRIGDSRLSEFLPLLPRALRLRCAGLDVFHAVSPYYSAPFVQNQVVSVLDVIPLDVESHSRTGLKAKVFHGLAKRAQCILTLSEHAKLRIADRLNFPESQIIVAPLPSILSPPAGPWKLDLPPRYITAMADLRTPDPRKRMEWLEGIASQLHQRGIPLVIVGGGTHKTASRFPGARVMGRVDDHALAEVLGRARALVYTSAYEGQGMPPLEAISLGTPVVAMRNTAIPEVVGEAGILLEEDVPAEVAARGPHRYDDPSIKRLADACAEVFENDTLHGLLSAACASQAQLFTLARFGEGVRKAYDLGRGKVK